MTPPPNDPRQAGLRLLHAALAGVAAFAIVAVGWIAVQALRNPDVRARRPRWLDASIAYDAAFWTPLLLTVVGGVLAVLYVLARAARRLRAGEDLYGNRSGQGVRRRGERQVREGEAD
ncbi:MAG TPA: hypothetical protein VD962_12870 [Rubricoccaceae bacterium]|nr:hypothetical protein [Rubricoccaceae bacterium]